MIFHKLFPHESKAQQSVSSATSAATSPSLSTPFVDSGPPDPAFKYALPNPNGNPLVRFLRATESSIERVIFDFRFLALLAVGGSLAGSLLCFLNWLISLPEPASGHMVIISMVQQLSQDSPSDGMGMSCVKGVHTGQMVLRLVEAIDVYLAGTVMLIFGMGLYGLFISNIPPDVSPTVDRALKGSSLFGMFAMKERPKWMKICSLDELKTKVGHVIVMILLVKMFERSKMVTIATGLDLLSYSVCIFLSSASLYILHNLHKSD
ncbi:unnamed protein product [Sphenostylis stenocarpa]|uniref:Structural constituent of ribosome n=1 Tax=Sphenostylis stenocarpa TaxID=92480 RepID=A0AA86SL57_9FABA|nr:unnamed protein product [Sphenostylis stenocarpa]